MSKLAFCSLPARYVDPAENARRAITLTSSRLRRVFTHFNKPAWQRTGRIQWSVHFGGKCHIVDHFETKGVNWESHTQKRQPVAVLRGFAREVSTYYSPARGQTVAEIRA